MKISIISAMAKDRTIGKENSIPWHITEDFQHFKTATLNKPVIMGRKTFHSMDDKPLPSRLNIVITKTDLKQDDITCFNSIEKAIKHCKELECEHIYLIGGQSIYQEGLEIADEIDLTIVEATVEDGNAFFPEFSEEIWELVSTEQHFSEKAGLGYSFNLFKRK